MEIRDVVDSDWAAVWGFLQQSVAPGGTYYWPPDTIEEGDDRQPGSQFAPRRAGGHQTWLPMPISRFAAKKASEPRRAAR